MTNEFQKIVLGRGAEGLCLKKAGSPYQVGERNDRWVKLKPEYFKGGPQDMDFLIVAGYFGEGRVRRDGGCGREQARVCEDATFVTPILHAVVVSAPLGQRVALFACRR